MSSENISSSESPVGEAPELTERRRSTTVIMTMNVTMPAETQAEGTGLRRNGSTRRRLSKQNATIEEPISLLSISDPTSDSAEAASVPCIEEHPEEGKEEAADNVAKSSDETKLQPPSATPRASFISAKSLSRESNGTEYSDRAGTDLRRFVTNTIHKSEEDRKSLLDFEKELKAMIMDKDVQSRKFELPSSYHRMMLHRCAAWFGLDHNVCNKKTDIVVNKSDRTKIPEESFSDLIRHDKYTERNFTHHSFTRQNTGGSRKDLQHMESFEQTNQFGSQASLNHDLLMMRRAQSFDVAGSVSPVMQQEHHHTRGLPMRQLSLNCPPQAVMAAPMSGPQARHWAPQRSFDCSNNSYLCTGKHPMMRKAESFGGMANGCCYETSVPMVCQTPPSVMVHHHHHHAHVPQAPYTGYQVFEEMSMPSPNYQPVPDQGMCSPGGTYYVPQQYTRPVRYMAPDYQPRRAQSSGMQYMYAPPQYVQYPPMVHPEVEVEVYVDPIEAQVDTFPQVNHFVVPPVEQQGYSSSHQAETANSFIKASIDGGYGSMNQEPEAGNAEKTESSSNASNAESCQ